MTEAENGVECDFWAEPDLRPVSSCLMEASNTLGVVRNRHAYVAYTGETMTKAPVFRCSDTDEFLLDTEQAQKLRGQMYHVV